VLPCKRQRFSALPARLERLEIANRESAAQWFTDGELPPSLGCRVQLSDGRRLGCQRQQRRCDQRRKPRALDLDPALERGRPGQIESVEKRTARQFHRSTPIAGDRDMELGEIAVDQRGIERQDRTARSNDFNAELVTHRVACLAKRMAGVLLIRFRPQVADQSLARNTSLARGRENGE